MPRISRRKFLRNAAISGAVLTQTLSSRPESALTGAPIGRSLPEWGGLVDAGEIPATPGAANPDFSAFKLHYTHPAPNWTNALPVGNGRLGAMVFGNPSLERIQLNEESIWDGERRDRDNPKAGEAVPKIRELLFAGKVHEAEALATSDMFSLPRRMPCYQTLGDLHLDFSPMGLTPETPVENYRLELDLDRAICTITFTHAGVTYTREVFSSHPDQVVVIRLSASQRHKLHFTARLDRPGPSPFEVHGLEKESLTLDGEALPVNDNPNLPVKEHQIGVRFHARMKAIVEDPEFCPLPCSHTQSVSTESLSNRSSLEIVRASSVTLLIDCATSFRHPAASGPNAENIGDPAAMRAAVTRNLDAAARRTYAQLRARHVADYQPIFRRATFSFGPDAKAATPTDVRLQQLKSGADDPGLFPLHFQFGRYLLISSSRPGTLAANLQGIWNESVDPPWGSKYTININAQMNYWLADRANLGDLHTPLFDLLDSTRAAGARVAKTYYNARGVVAHHNTDVWGDAGPIDTLGGGIWAMGGAWLTTHLWDHYLYTGDTAFLRSRAYPRLKEAATFLLDYLVEAPQGTADAGHLTTGPSCSPENAYRLPDGKHANLCMGPTMDIAITRAIFAQTTEAARILNLDEPFRAQTAAAATRLPAYKIGHNGGLQEWPEDYPETEPGHRHISHLWGMYPNDQITLRGTPTLAEAARKTLDLRLAAGGGSTGWSRAWVINCYARLEDGERCHQQLLELLKLSTRDNLFDVCGIKANSVYQIDGNLGGPAGMAEMLLQSHGGIVRLLPALPSAWPDGHFSGLRARGGYTVDLTWRNGRIQQATLTATLDGECTLAIPHGQQIKTLTPTSDGLYKFKTRPNKTYTFLFT